MNYGEEYALWYLRLNGFFPISNFVIHKSGEISNSSDCDVLAIRFPNVFEEVGGQENDWDDWLRGRFNFDKIIGIICEVKTGGYEKNKLFRKNNVQYCVGRLGFVPQRHIGEVSNQFDGQQIIDLNSQYQLGKLLIANNGSETERYFYIDLGSIISFLDRRIERYPEEKYRDRMFFSSILFQSMIDRVALKREHDNSTEGA
jgi:hypothetical protein